MNYHKFIALWFLVVNLAFAQLPWEIPSEQNNPVPEEAPSYEPTPPPLSTPSLPPPTPVSKPAPDASQGKSGFDQLRGHAYNPFGTAGVANNIYDLILTPSEINGQKFVYIAPDPRDYLGYAAFDFFGGSALMGLDNSGDAGALILGYATPVFGLALNYSVYKEWESIEYTDNTTRSQRTTYPGDNIGLFFSMPLGFGTLYANASWLTYDRSYSYTAEGYQNGDDNGDIKVDYSTIDGAVGIIGNIGSLHYDAQLNVVRSGGILTSSITNQNGSPNSGDRAVDLNDPAYLLTAIGVNLGYVALQSQTARAIVGFNNIFGVIFLDDIGTTQYNSGNIILLAVSPNILGEFIVSDNWLAFAGATHRINLIVGPNVLGDDWLLDDSDLTILQEKTSAFAGLRYKKTNWALEAQVSANPFGAFAGNNILANFGGFIYF